MSARGLAMLEPALRELGPAFERPRFRDPRLAELEQLVDRHDPRPYLDQLLELGHTVNPDHVPSWWSWDCRPSWERDR